MWTESKMAAAHESRNPTRFKTYQLKESQMLDALDNCGSDQQQAIIMNMPDPQGSLQEFQIWKSKVASPDLVEKYPNLQTYQGVLAGANEIRIRIENSDSGIQAMIIDKNDTWYIAPAIGEEGSYIVYYKSDLPADAKNFWSDKVIKKSQP